MIVDVRFPWSFSFVGADKDWIFFFNLRTAGGRERQLKDISFVSYFCNEISARNFLNTDLWFLMTEKTENGLVDKDFKRANLEFFLLSFIKYHSIWQMLHDSVYSVYSPLNVTTDIFLAIHISKWTLHQKYLWKPWECHNLQPDHS